ncbi:MAG: hypothetical protein JWM43_3619 [Acidobacteriaceae bacterium]|nr:hypothetical protein [Acidobacteriaceae bacterium]
MIANDNTPTQVVLADASSLRYDLLWIAVERVLASQQFVKSARLSAFLRYVGRRALDGNIDEITEQQIGLHVFKRPADFNAGEDNIVRSSARQLRQRLALYYQEDGKDDAIRIEVPRGGYVPVFVDCPREVLQILAPAESPPAIAIPDLQAESPVEPTRGLLQRRLLLLVAGITFLLGIATTILLQRWLNLQRQHHTVSHQLWSSLFVPGRNTLLVPGDAGLNMYNNLARTQVSVGDYITGAYLREPAAQTPAGYLWSPFAERRYTSIVDLNFTDRLREVPEFLADHYSVRFARDIHVSDFRNANVILTGAPTYNPWIELFDNNLNFHIIYDGATNKIRVVNRSPRAGEKSEYAWTADDPSHRGYAYIALVDNLQGVGKVLLIEGTTMAGVDAADAFLLNDKRMPDILKQATTTSELNNFELLLEASVIDGSSPDAKVIATRIYKNQ